METPPTTHERPSWLSQADSDSFEAALAAADKAGRGNATQQFFRDGSRWRIRIKPTDSLFVRWLVWRKWATLDDQGAWFTCNAADGNSAAHALMVWAPGVTSTTAYLA